MKSGPDASHESLSAPAAPSTDRWLRADEPHLRHRTDHAIARTVDYLRNQQDEDGYWCAELEGDTILESEYILLLAWLGKADSEPAAAAARYLLQQQSDDGGWSLYPGGPLEISVSVKAYFALKLTGHAPEAAYMLRARQAILAAGGADRVNSFTRFYLALLGQIPYSACPAVPPEMVLLPNWSPVNLYRMSSWSRTIMVPLSIMWACRPTCEIDPALGISELFIQSPSRWRTTRCVGQQSSGLLSWDRFFRLVDGGLKLLERCRIRPLRGKALKLAEQWMTERFVGSDGLGAIFPPIIWSIVALKCRGYSDDSPLVRYCHQQLEALQIREGDTLRLQPCKSPVWDTALTLRALEAGGLDSHHQSIRRGVRWLLKKEVTRRGDWGTNVAAEPSGWFFEHHNEFYPDLDDTAMVMMALRDQFSADEYSPESLTEDIRVVLESRAASTHAARMHFATLDRAAAACERARRWVLAMQNRDGGWGAFDKDNDSEFLCAVPFADHNAMIDPSTPDLTGRVLEALGSWGAKVGSPAVDQAVAYLRKSQESDGSWYGRWGVNYIYGTWQSLVGLVAVGVPVDDPVVARGADWLLAHQQSSGGWGETPASYDDPSLRGTGTETPSQTAWALLGLLAAGRGDHPAVARGASWLLERQNGAGDWDEAEVTGTGFPRVFYLKYHLYRVYFPLLALARWRKQQQASAGGSA